MTHDMSFTLGVNPKLIFKKRSRWHDLPSLVAMFPVMAELPDRWVLGPVIPFEQLHFSFSM